MTATAVRPPCPGHPRAPAVATCAGCGLFLCAECEAAGARRCLRCRGAGHPIPWEDPSLGAPRAFLRTLRLLVKGDGFFAALPSTGGLRAPLTFAATAATLGAAAAALSAALLLLLGGGLLAGVQDAVVRAAPGDVRDFYRLTFQVLGSLQQSMLQLAVGWALLAPVLAPIELLIMGALTHGVARLLGGKGTFEATVRAQGYAAGAHVLKVVPVAGNSLAMLVLLLLTGAGLRRAHGVSTGRAFVLTLWWVPVALVLACLFTGLLVNNVLLPFLLGR